MRLKVDKNLLKPVLPIQPPVTPEDIPVELQINFREIKGQEHTKRALKRAAAADL